MTSFVASVRRVPPAVPAMIAAAWALAIIGETSGLASRLHHDELIDGGPPAAVALALFLLAWQVHVAAMMLPSSLPLIALFERVSAARPDRRAARAAFLAGYAVVWSGVGVAVFAADAVLHRTVDGWGWLAQRPGLIPGAVLLGAGAFQFSALKDRCLRECRHPAGFITRYYERGTWPAWRLGVRHGLFCLGCCWALMVVLVAVGATNLAWMAPLTMLMLVEKTSPTGDRVVRWAGVGLTALGALLLAATIPS